MMGLLVGDPPRQAPSRESASVCDRVQGPAGVNVVPVSEEFDSY